MIPDMTQCLGVLTGPKPLPMKRKKNSIDCIYSFWLKTHVMQLKNLVHAAWQHKNNFGETHCRKKANSELFSKAANNKLQSPMDLCILVTLTWLKFAWVYSKLFSKSCDYFSKQVLFPLKPEQGHYQYMFWYLAQSSSVQIWTWETFQSDSSENLEAQGFILLQNPSKCF